MAFLLFIILPLLEIAGFVVIGSKIGFGYTILWLIAAIFLGIYSLAFQGKSALTRANKSINNDTYPLKEMFDGIFIIIGALLLIFPGFVSDIIAVFFLTPPIRWAIYEILKAQNESVLEEFTKSGESFTSRYYENDIPNNSSTIEGEYTVVNKEKTSE